MEAGAYQTFATKADTRKLWDLQGGIEGETMGQSWQLIGFWKNWWDVNYAITQRSYAQPGGAAAVPTVFENPQSTYGVRFTIRGRS
ncbi:MAG: hypothetical protein HXY25_01590 [Alphaproteobacteria bacterium]|nr:hypothetical protein [Alphaproteobacteria bacterium]